MGSLNQSKMTKEEAIKEAYGEYWFEVRMFVNENGWFDKNSLYNNQFTFKYSDFDAQMIHKQDFCIPKSLQGIEDNNGWIKVESEDDLPKKYDFYHACYFEGSYKDDIPMFYAVNLPDLKEYLKDGLITHYQPIQKPKPPIY